MGMDFNVDVNVKTNGKDEVDALERQIQKLQNTKINLNVTLGGNGLDLSKLFSGIEKQTEKAGKSISTALQTQIETMAKTQRNAFSQPLDNITKQQQSYIDSFDKQLKQREKIVNQINSKISNKSYETSISSLNADLNKYSKNAIQYKDAEKSINDLSNAYKQLQTASEAYEKVGSNVNYDALIKAQDNLNNAMQRTRNEMKMLGNDQNKLLDASTIASTKKSFASYLDNNSKAVRAYKEEIAQLEEQLENMTTVADKANFDIGVKNLQTRAIKEGNTGKSALEDLGRAMKQIGQFAGIYNVIQNLAFDVPQQIYQAIYDVDTAMTNLYKVTDETSSKYNEFLDNVGTKSQELGRSMSSLITQTSEWAKLGFTLDEATKLSEISSIYANVGEVDDATAVSDLVTAMKAFNIEATDSMQIVDQLNILGNQFATSSADLGEGLTKSASAMNVAGTDLNHTLAMLTGGAEITQNAGEFGNFLKVASMRIRGRLSCLHTRKVCMPCYAQ